MKQIDQKTCLILLSIVKDLSFMFFHNEALRLLSYCLLKYSNRFESLRHPDYKRMKDILIGHKNEIPEEIFMNLNKYLSDVIIEANHIYENNQGIVVHYNGNYGFIANANNSRIYFNNNHIAHSIGYGDMVEFEVYENEHGKAAKNVKKVS